MLSTHDAVVIPGFGGFISKYKPARIADDTGYIHPPTKYIAFNERLDIHDNTFARYLDEKTSAHYSPRLFDLFVSRLKSDLLSNQVIVVPKVGRLYQDYEGATHFMPDLLNLNNETFGLPQIACQKGDWATRSIAKATQRLKEGSFRTALSSAATVAFLFILVWVATGGVKDGSISELSIIDTITEHDTPADTKEKEVVVLDAIGGDKVEATLEKEGSIVHEAITKPERSVVKDAKPSQKAIIIVGAFGSAANAEKMVSKIEDLGFNAYQDQPSRLNRVGVEATYTSQEELDSILSTVQKSITLRAWILK